MNKSTKKKLLFLVGIFVFIWIPLYGTTTSVSVKDFGAKGDGITDDTGAFNAALSSSAYVKVLIPFGKYRISGQITMPEGTELMGVKGGMGQGPASDQSKGPGRSSINEDSLLLIKPNANTNTPITMGKNSVLRGLSITYPDQSDNIDYNPIIEFAPTITATHGATVKDIRFWGSFDFFEGVGESILLEKIYGYALGTAFSIKNSSDVVHINDIHLNPNVQRPAYNILNTRASDTDSIGFYFENVDGAFLRGIHLFGFRTGVKIKGGSSGTQTAIDISQFFFDAVGLAFDMDSDSGWGGNISNGICVTGFSDKPDYAGLIKFSKTVSNNMITPINITNVNSSVGNSTTINYTTPSFQLNFNAISGYRVQLSGIVLSGAQNIIDSVEYNQITGGVVSGSSFINLTKKDTARNLLKNSDLQQTYKNASDGTIQANHWTKDGNFTISRLNNGHTRLMAGGPNAYYKGLYQRYTFEEARAATLMVKAKEVKESTGIFVQAWNNGWTDQVQYKVDWVNYGSYWFAKIIFDGDNKPIRKIYEIKINPGESMGNYVDIEWAAIVPAGSWYTTEKPESSYSDTEHTLIKGTNPYSVIPPYLGAMYLNTGTKQFYMAAGTSSIYDWKLIN